MKRVYTVPRAEEEAFVANSYVASCELSIHAKKNGMQCANPSHSHFMNGSYFTSVWVAAAESDCTIVVDGSFQKTRILGNDNSQPERGATVYGENGEKYACTQSYNRSGHRYFVPDFVRRNGRDNPCYGTYVNEGTIEEIGQKVMS